MHFTIHFPYCIFFCQVFETSIFQVIFHFNTIIFRKNLLPNPDTCNLLFVVRNFVLRK